MLITKRSPVTGKNNTIDLLITDEQFRRWKMGEDHIQNIMPHLTSSEREFLISGCTELDWATLFPPGSPAKATGEEGI